MAASGLALATLPACQPASADPVQLKSGQTRLNGNLELPALRTLIRAFSVYFDLINLAEQRARVRALKLKAQSLGSAPMAESPEVALRTLRDGTLRDGRKRSSHQEQRLPGEIPHEIRAGAPTSVFPQTSECDQLVAKPESQCARYACREVARSLQHAVVIQPEQPVRYARQQP